MKTADVAAILQEAKRLLASRPFQTRFIAALDTGETEIYRDDYGNKRERPKWEMCSPSTPDAMLSFRGAIIAATGSGPKAFQVFDAISSWGINIRTTEPRTKADALLLLSDCLRMAEKRLSIEPETV